MKNLPSIHAADIKNKRRAIMVDFFQKGFVHHNMQHDSMYVINQQNIKMKSLERQMQIQMMSNYSSEKRTQVAKEIRETKEMKERNASLPHAGDVRGSFYTQLPTEMRSKQPSLGTIESKAEVLQKRMTNMQKMKASLRSKTIKEFFHYFDTSDINL